MGDSEVTISFTAKELLQHLGGKIDNLDAKFDKFAENVDSRLQKVETSQMSIEKLEDFKIQVAANVSRTKWSIYGLGITGLGVVGDALLHFFKVK